MTSLPTTLWKPLCHYGNAEAVAGLVLHHEVSQPRNERPQPLPLFGLITCNDEITIQAFNEKWVLIRC